MYLNVSGDIVLYAFIRRLSEAIVGICCTGGVLPRAGIDGWHHLRVSGLGLYQIGGRWRCRPRRPLLVDLTRIWQNLVMAIIWLLYLLLKMMMSCSVRRGCLGARLHVMRVWSRRARPRWRHQRTNRLKMVLHPICPQYLRPSGYLHSSQSASEKPQL